VGLRVVYSPRAIGDLHGITRYIGSDNPEAARRFRRSLVEHIKLLADFPLMGPEWEKRPGIRSLVHTPYRVFYRVNGPKQAVEIITVWHAARGDPEIQPGREGDRRQEA